MTFQESIRTCLTKYADFTGRASRSEFWWFALAMIILEIVATYINVVVYYIVVLAFFLPYLAVLVRRLHDVDRTGWWVLIGIIPVLGWIVLLVFAVMEGTPGPNRFGPPPTVLEGQKV